MSTLFCNNIYASFYDKKLLNNVSLELKQGEFISLIGLNGAGKSTLLSLLCGLESPNLIIDSSKDLPSIKKDDGSIVKIKDLKRNEVSKYISYLQQSEYSMWDYSVRDFILQGRFPYTKHGLYSKLDKEVVNTVINELSLKELKNRNIHSLSGGELQKVKIARCLAQQPKFILLDEPSSNLDVVFEPRLLMLLKDLTKTKNIGVLLTIHDINITSEITDKVCLLYKDGIISGSYKDVMTIENLKTTFGVDFQCSEKKYFQLSQ